MWVPLDVDGWFFLPLWTDFQVGPQPGILDWYTVTVGLAAYFTLAMHGALWVALKTAEPVRDRAQAIARVAWWCVVLATIVVTAATFHVQPHVPARLAAEPWGAVFPALAVSGLAAVYLYRQRSEIRAFLASCAYIVGMLTSVVFGVYPFVLPSSTDPALGLDVANAAAAPYGLKVGLVWFIPGMLLVTAYFLYTYRNFAGKVRLDEQGSTAS